LSESNVLPSGLALAATCAPTWPAAPAFVSTTTGCLRIGSIAAASGRVTMSLAPPGGKALIIVIACEGKASCASTGPHATSAVVPATKLRRSIVPLRPFGSDRTPSRASPERDRSGAPPLQLVWRPRPRISQTPQNRDRPPHRQCC